MSWVSGLVLAAVVVSLVRAVGGRERRAESATLVRRLRPAPFVANLPAIAAVMVAFGLLYQVPWLQWGWYTLVAGTPGNAMVASATSSLWVFAPFLVLLVVAMPQLVLAEEEAFRDDTRSWAQAARRSVVFGLMHCVVGVPIAAGLALTIAGLWFSHQYFRGGTQRSALYHLAWNYLLVAALSVLVVSLSLFPG